MLVGTSCTAELIQDDPAGLAQALQLPIPVVPLELPSYQRKENWGASETFYSLVRALAKPFRESPPGPRARTSARSVCNLLGPTALGFRHRDDLAEVTRQVVDMGIEIGVVAPWNATPSDIARLPEADFNIVLYPEIALTAAQWLQRNFDQPFTRTVPIGVAATRKFIEEVAQLAGVDPASALDRGEQRSSWYSRSVDSTYLTDKRVFVFGDATHAIAAARVAANELGFKVVGLGSYSREFARDVREAASLLRRRGSHHRRLSRGRGQGQGDPARTCAGHPDGASHRQTVRHSLRGYLRARPTCRISPRAIRPRWDSKAPT